MSIVSFETVLFITGSVSYMLAALLAVLSLMMQTQNDRDVLGLSLFAVFMLGISITVRWIDNGAGPFLTMYEILLSNLFSLGLIYCLCYLLLPDTRVAALPVLSFLSMLAVWAAHQNTAAVPLPATYDTLLLWVHVGVGKFFLGLCLVAAGLSVALLVRHVTSGSDDDAGVDRQAWRLMLLAFLFHGMMLIAGAAWAQDAWGRFWAWDSLETWAFITWLLLGLSLHLRLTWNIRPWVGWVSILIVFSFALMTFFGVPFTNSGPHRGII